MHKPLSLAIAAALAALVTPVSYASEASSLESPSPQSTDAKEAKNLDTLIVTGSRAPRSVDKIPGAVSVISKQEISRSLSLTEDATAILSRTIPGYAESTQAMTNASETLRGRIALRLFDGVPQTSPLRETNRAGSFTDLGIIGRVEVLNGPSAAEGLGAAGGIINYISVVPEEGTQASLSTRWSTQGRGDSDGWKVGLTLGHKEEAYDVVVASSFVDRGMAYDGSGRAMGMMGAGTINDSSSKNLFVKFGLNFGEDGMQRLQGSVSRFNVEGKGNYIGEDAQRSAGKTSTAVRGIPLNSKTEFNDFNQVHVQYRHDNVFGGSLSLDAYKADQAMRYPAENGIDKQDPLLAPVGELVDASEISSQKEGVRVGYSRPSLFSVEGLELRTGVDQVEDTTDQNLALTRRLWVPPMTYKSTAPYAQLTYDTEHLTLSAGVRHERGELSVSDYTTTWYRNRVFVQGGTLKYKDTLPNLGIVWRFNDVWSAYASYSEGFNLPNVGIPLRNMNTPGQSVAGLVDLKAVIVDNKEVGFNYRGDKVTASASIYRSYSDLGVSLSVDPITNDYIMDRAPVLVRGVEASVSYDVMEALSVNAMYSRILGTTTWVVGGPLDKQMGVSDISPDRFASNLTWRPKDAIQVVLSANTYMGRQLNTGERTSGRTLFDVSVGYDTGRYGRLALGIENLTDKFYEMFPSQASRREDQWFTGRGRSFSISHQITF